MTQLGDDGSLSLVIFSSRLHVPVLHTYISTDVRVVPFFSLFISFLLSQHNLSFTIMENQIFLRVRFWIVKRSFWRNNHKDKKNFMHFFFLFLWNDNTMYFFKQMVRLFSYPWWKLIQHYGFLTVTYFFVFFVNLLFLGLFSRVFFFFSIN